MLTELIDAHSTALQLLGRQWYYKGGFGVGDDTELFLAYAAASCALTLGDEEHVLVFLERGCAVFWARMLELRNTFSALSIEHAKDVV